jgi:hypothetical protein
MQNVRFKFDSVLKQVVEEVELALVDIVFTEQFGQVDISLLPEYLKEDTFPGGQSSQELLSAFGPTPNSEQIEQELDPVIETESVQD